MLGVLGISGLGTVAVFTAWAWHWGGSRSQWVVRCVDIGCQGLGFLVVFVVRGVAFLVGFGI